MLAPIIALLAVILMVAIFIGVQAKTKDRGNKLSASD